MAIVLWRPGLNLLGGLVFLAISAADALGLGPTWLPLRVALALWFALAAARFALVRVVVGPHTVTAHNVLRTCRVNWSDVAGIVEPTPGISGVNFGIVTRDGRVIQPAAFPKDRLRSGLSGEWNTFLAWCRSAALARAGAT